MLKHLLVVGLLLVCGGARAAIIVTLDHLPASGDFDWVYNITLQSEGKMLVKDFATIYDFPGLQSFGFVASSDPKVAGHTFVASTQLTGDTPSGVNAGFLKDNPLLANVTVTLTDGSDIIPIGANVLLGKLTLTGLTDQVGERIKFTSLAAQQAGSTPVVQVGTTPAAVPEATTMGFMGAGLLAVAALALRRRKELV